MNELLARAGALLLAPPPSATRSATLAPADLVGVLAAPPDLAAVAGGIAADLRHRQRARTALVCRSGPLSAGPAAPAARGLARRLRERDLAAGAAGTLCQVALSDAHEAWRAIAPAAGSPVVIAFTARTAAVDELLAGADHLYLAPPDLADPVYVEAALASLAALGPPADVVVPPPGLVARRAAALGLLRLRPSADEVPA